MPPRPFTLAIPLVLAPLATACNAPAHHDASDTDKSGDTDGTQVTVDTDTPGDTDIADTDVPYEACASDLCFDGHGYNGDGLPVLALAIGDWDGEGNADIVFTTQGEIAWMTGTGTASTADDQTTKLDDSVGAGSPDVVLAQLDDDGVLDLAAAGNGIDVSFGDGTGGVAASSSFQGEGTAYDLAVGDILGTGPTDDLAYGGDCAFVVEMSGNQGDAPFGDNLGFCSPHIVGLGPTSGAESSMIGLSGTTIVAWQLIPGETLAAGGPVSLTLPASGVALAMANLDGDTYEDNVALLDDGSVAVLMSDGEGFWRSVGEGVYFTIYPVGAGPHDVATGDFDGDGDLDVVVSNTDDDTLTLLINDGSGTMTTSTMQLADGAAPRRLATGDLNGDGKADIVVSTTAPDAITVLLTRD